MNNLQKTLIERYTEKKFNDRNFTYRNYLDLRRKLTNKNIQDTQKQNKVQEKIKELTNAPKTRDVSPLIAEQIFTATTFGCMALGATVANMVGDPNIPVYDGAIVGMAIGSLAGSFGNLVAYANKPLTKVINKTIIKAKDKKVKAIERRKELRDYTLYCFRQQERENTPTYEDFLKAVQDSDNEFTK